MNAEKRLSYFLKFFGRLTASSIAGQKLVITVDAFQQEKWQNIHIVHSEAVLLFCQFPILTVVSVSFSCEYGVLVSDRRNGLMVVWSLSLVHSIQCKIFLRECGFQSLISYNSLFVELHDASKRLYWRTPL